MTLDDIVSKLDLTDIRYSEDGKTLRRQLLPYFKKLYPDAEIPLPDDWIDGGMPIATPDDFLEAAKRSENLKRMMKASGQTYNFPSEYSYEFEIGRWHDQRRGGVDEGTCYTESTTAYVEWWLWMKTGTKYEISDNEIRDIGSDSKGLSYSARQIKDNFAGGHMASSLPAIYNFNNHLEDHYWTNKQRSTACAKFKELVDNDLGGWKIDVVSWDDDALKEHLFRKGPCVIGWDGHATLFCAYDSKNIYWRDSYYKSYNWDHLRSMTWSDWHNRRNFPNDFVCLKKPYNNA